MSTHLAELIFSSTSVIEPASSLQIRPKTLDTRAPPLRHPYSPKHSVFHLSSAFHHTYAREFFPSEHHISFEILFYSIVLVMSSVVYFDTIAHDLLLFSTKSSVFSQQFSCESHTLLNRL